MVWQLPLRIRTHQYEPNRTDPTEFRSTIPDQNFSTTYCKAIFDAENKII